jgi:hypothetical protein
MSKITTPNAFTGIAVKRRHRKLHFPTGAGIARQVACAPAGNASVYMKIQKTGQCAACPLKMAAPRRLF